LLAKSNTRKKKKNYYEENLFLSAKTKMFSTINAHIRDGRLESAIDDLAEKNSP